VSPSNGKRVLITGGSGFTGRYVIPRLQAEGYEVIDPETSGRFDLIDVGTLQAKVAEARPDYVIHLAALSFVAHGDPAAFYRVNAVGTTNLLDALVALPKRPHRVILASSANVYGNATDDPITEGTPVAPVNHYAASKVAMEHLAVAYMDRLPICITRPFNYTGLGQRPDFLIPKLVGHFAARKPFIELGNVDVVRDFSDVRAVTEAYLRLLTSEPAPRLTNICSGVGRSLREVLSELEQLSGHRLEIRINPAFVRAQEVRRLVGSASTLIAAVGPLPYQDFRETLAWMLEGCEQTV
jgi:nucleoside-diphosphate-sugar epimerase